MLGEKLGNNAAPVSKLDKTQEGQAFAPGCTNLPGLDNIYRPGNAKTNHHKRFK
jgi:hypothetical protein